MFQLLLIALMLSALISPTWANTPFFFYDNKKSILGIGLDGISAPRQLNSNRAIVVSDGMTLKELVGDLGPGYTGPAPEGAGIIRWYFSNGKILYVHPRTYTQMDVLQFHPKDGNGSLMCWSK